MKVFRLSTWLYVGLLFALAACQPVTRQPELPTLIEHKIPTHSAHAGGITVGADGALWFAETGANQIGRITVDGVVTEYPIPTEDAMEDSQGFVGLGPDGAIWFNEDLVNKLGRITPDGEITEFDLPEGTGGIREMVAGPDGNLWVTASFVNKILKLSTDGEVFAEYTMPTANSRPVGMVVGPDGAFWFVQTGANQIGRMTLEGDITEYAIPTADSFPLRLTVGPDNALWFTMYSAHKIGRISLEGEVTEFDVSGMGPVGIATGADGALWFTGYQSTEIGRLTTDGVLTKLTIPTYAAVPYRIVAGPDGNLWFTEQQGNQIGQIKLPATTAEQEPVVALTTFSSKPFKLPMSISFGSQWKVVEDYPDVVTLVNNKVDVDFAFIIVKDVKVADPKNSFSKVAFPDDFVTWIQEHGLFPVVKTQPVVVAGFHGIQINSVVTADCGTKRNWLFLSKTGWNCRTDEYYHFIYLEDVYGERVLIMNTGGDSSEKDFNLGVEAAQEVLDTVVFPKPTTTFSSKIFELPMSVSFGTEWLVADEKPGVVQLRGHDVDLAFMTTKDAKIVGPEASAEAPFSMVPFPDDFVTWIQSHGLFQVVETQPVVVGGFPGIQINTIVTTACVNDRQWVFPLGTDWRCGTSGDPIRFIYLDDVYGEHVLIFTEGLRAEEDFMLGGEAAQKVLDTVVFPKPTTTFSSDKFRLPMSVSFDSDWHVIDDFTDLVTVAHKPEDWNVAFNIVTDAKVADPVSGSQIPFPEDFASWIQSNPNFEVDEPTEVMVAGMQGLQIDATPTTTKKQDFLYLSGTTWNIIPSPERWRFILFNDVNGARLLILLIAPAAEFKVAVEEAQEVLDTVVFTKPTVVAPTTVATQAQTTFAPKLVKTPMSINFGSDWSIKYNLPNRFAIDQLDGSNLTFYTVSDAKLADPVDEHLIPFPQDFLAWIKSNPDFAAGESTSVTVAGVKGVQIDATPIWKSTKTNLKLFLALGGAGWENRENIVNDPEQWRFILLNDVHGERVLMILIAGNGHKFEDAVEQSQKVLDTVVFLKP